MNELKRKMVTREHLNSLTCTFWNIHGHKSQYVGNKLCDPGFVEILSSSDIVGLGELHAEEKVSIQGFINKKQKIREKNLRGQR